jgi:hypothetical protein
MSSIFFSRPVNTDLPEETRARFPKKIQHRVDLQRLRDRLGTLVDDLVAAELELGHHRVDLQRLCDRIGTN